MAKQKVNPQFRIQLSEKLMDLGNLAIAALIFGQLVGGKEFSIPILILGVSLATACYFISYIVSLKLRI